MNNQTDPFRLALENAARVVELEAENKRLREELECSDIALQASIEACADLQKKNKELQQRWDESVSRVEYQCVELDAEIKRLRELVKDIVDRSQPVFDKEPWRFTPFESVWLEKARAALRGKE